MTTTAELIKAGAESDLLFLWAEHKVDPGLQLKLVSEGVNSVQRFAGLDADWAAVRDTLAEALTYDPKKLTLKEKASLADFKAAWEASQTRQRLSHEAKEHARASGLPRPVGNKDYQGLKEAFEATYDKLPLDEQPGKPLIARRLDQLEENDPYPEPLTDVASREDGEDDLVVTQADPSGLLKAALHKAKKLPLPNNPEQLRKRHKVLENSYLFTGFRHHACT